MRRRALLSLVLLALAVHPAPAQPPARPPAPPPRDALAAALPTVALPPALDRVLRDYERAWAARDPDALAALFAEDGMVLSGPRPPARGRAAVRERYVGQGGPLHLRAVAHAADDTVGYVVGVYAEAPGRPPLGKFVLALRRRPGGPWRIAADMDTPIAPPRRPAGRTP